MCSKAGGDLPIDNAGGEIRLDEMDCILDGFVRISTPSPGNWRLGSPEAVITETRRGLLKPGAGFHETGRLVSNGVEAEVGWVDPWPRESSQAKATLSDLGPGDTTTTVIPHRRNGNRQPESSGVSIPSSSPPQITRTGIPKQEAQWKWKIYTDGGCRGNPGGVGGWAAIIIPPDPAPRFAKIEEVSGGCQSTTNNRMELKALIEGLVRIPESEGVDVVTDSKYLIMMAQKAISGNSLKKDYKNLDLIHEIRRISSGLGKVSFTWVRGHSGDQFNEKCDRLCRMEMDWLERGV